MHVTVEAISLSKIITRKLNLATKLMFVAPHGPSMELTGWDIYVIKLSVR